MDPTLQSLVESVCCAPDELKRSEAATALASALKKAVKAGELEAAATALRAAAVPGLEFTSAQSLCRLLPKIKPVVKPLGPKLKLAVLSSFTADQLTQFMELYLFGLGVNAEVYKAEFGTFRQEILDPDSELYKFSPNVVFIATSWRDLGHRPGLGDTLAAVEQNVDREFEDWATLWTTAHERLRCQIVQNNFEAPPSRLLDNHELRKPGSFSGYVARMNLRFAERAPAYVTLHDIDHLSANAGRRAWGDERYFHLAKIPCAPEYQVDYAHGVASVLAAHVGLAKKCLVLDLDNTLWGGVIGDDGLGGIRLGQGDAEGEAFLTFQRYAKGLKDRGVILAVCSKNNENTAKEVFEKHTEMVLRLTDISCFVANWTDKAANLRAIAQRLNIGLNSLVFADDNPAERAIVRQLVPEVAVPELPTDPAGYVWAIEQHRYFQVTSLGTEDLKRTAYYQANAERDSLASAAGDVEGFLTSLKMTARVEPITDLNLERSAQLINKSNQFNLTTRRRSAAEVLAVAKDPQWLTRTVTLADRFGDNGLISVLLAKVTKDALEIDTWLMSCRVLKRGVEHLLLNELAAAARERGLTKLRGEYLPTAKNAMVSKHYEGLGFTKTGEGPDGRTSWELNAGDTWQPAKVFIEKERVHG